MTKKSTKIYSTDTEALDAAITEAEGRATARTNYAELPQALPPVEDR